MPELQTKNKMIKEIKEGNCHILEIPKTVCTIRLMEIKEDDIYINQEGDCVEIQICDKKKLCQQLKKGL